MCLHVCAEIRIELKEEGYHDEGNVHADEFKKLYDEALACKSGILVTVQVVLSVRQHAPLLSQNLSPHPSQLCPTSFPRGDIVSGSGKQDCRLGNLNSFMHW